MLIVVLAMAAGLGDLTGYPQVARYGVLPKEVRVLIDRRLQCEHWAGEEPYDAARRREINAALRSLRCNGVEREEKRLEARYAGAPNVLKALSDSRDWQ